jgi:hypothetical protein
VHHSLNQRVGVVAVNVCEVTRECRSPKLSGMEDGMGLAKGREMKARCSSNVKTMENGWIELRLLASPMKLIREEEARKQ